MITKVGGGDSGTTGIDDDFAARGFENVGPWILGRNMFGPIRGPYVRIGGGPNVIRQYLRAGLIDELHIAIAPVLLCQGEPLFQGIDMRALGYECVRFAASERAAHLVLVRA